MTNDAFPVARQVTFWEEKPMKKKIAFCEKNCQKAEGTLEPFATPLANG